MDNHCCIKTLKYLREKDRCLSILKDIFIYVEQTPNLEVEITNRLLSSPEIYICLEEAEVEKSSQFLLLIIDILNLCMNNLSLRKEPFDLGRLLHKALTNRYTRIKLLAVQKIHREIAKIKNNVYPHVNITDVISLELFLYMLTLLRENQKNKLGSTAFHIFSDVLDKYLDEPTVKDALLDTLEKPGINLHCRLYEMACSVGLVSESNFKKIKFMLDHAIDELKKIGYDNFKIKILEAIETCADRYYGFKYLKKHAVFEMLVRRVQEIEDVNVPLSLSIMQFFSGVAGAQPSYIMYRYPNMMYRFFQAMYSYEDLIMPTVFKSFASLTLSDEAVMHLDSLYPCSIKHVFDCYLYYINILRCEVATLCALESLEIIFSYKVKSAYSNVIQIMHRWFKYLNNGTNTMTELVKCCRSSNSKIRVAALYLVRAICLYPWAIKAFNETPGIMNDILTREEYNNAVHCAQRSLIDVLSDAQVFETRTINIFYKYIDRKLNE